MRHAYFKFGELTSSWLKSIIQGKADIYLINSIRCFAHTVLRCTWLDRKAKLSSPKSYGSDSMSGLYMTSPSNGPNSIKVQYDGWACATWHNLKHLNVRSTLKIIQPFYTVRLFFTAIWRPIPIVKRVFKITSVLPGFAFVSCPYLFISYILWSTLAARRKSYWPWLALNFSPFFFPKIVLKRVVMITDGWLWLLF